MMRRTVRSGLELLLGGALADRRIRYRHQGDLLVLTFHNVVPDDAPRVGDRSLHVPLSMFTELVDRLLAVCVAVRLGEERTDDGRPKFAVTFDDAYRGAIHLGLGELQRRGVPATVFVPTSLIGDRDFWWDAVADVDGGLSPTLRMHALNHLRGDDRLIREWATSNGRAVRTMAPEWRSATVEELRTIARMPGVDLAPHSASHRALDRLTEAELRTELTAPFDWFEANTLAYRRVLSYPYGRASAMVRDEAARAGYESAWMVSGGWCGNANGGSFAMHRLNVSGGLSAAGMMLRAAGIDRA